MDNVVKYVPKQAVALMDSSERKYFYEQLIGAYASISQLLEMVGEPLCPSSPDDRVVTDFHGASWASILQRVDAGLHPDIRKEVTVRVELPSPSWLKKKNVTYAYNRDIFLGIYKRVSSTVALRARSMRAPVMADDFSDEDIQRLIEEGLPQYFVN